MQKMCMGDFLVPVWTIKQVKYSVSQSVLTVHDTIVPLPKAYYPDRVSKLLTGTVYTVENSFDIFKFKGGLNTLNFMHFKPNHLTWMQ